MLKLKTRIETLFFQESIVFYSELLGMNILESWDEKGDKGTILGLQGEALLELAYAETSRAYEGLSLQFRVRDLVDVAERLRGHLESDEPEERPWESKYRD